jgi:hypothetical protein
MSDQSNHPANLVASRNGPQTEVAIHPRGEKAFATGRNATLITSAWCPSKHWTSLPDSPQALTISISHMFRTDFKVSVPCGTGIVAGIKSEIRAVSPAEGSERLTHAPFGRSS